jgi:hypothetical protein
MIHRLPSDVFAVALELAREGVARGASSVVVAGSYVRGDARPDSDIDLYFIGDGPEYGLSRRGSFLISSSWQSVEAVRASLREPGRVGGVVPGWRRAVILHDTDGIAAGLQQEAIDWIWEDIGDAILDRYVADGITGFAEEVHKLVSNRDAGRSTAAAAQRSILALRLAPLLSVHLRMLYETENRLWDLVDDAMGDGWAGAQSAALGMAGESLDATCDAALELYALACRRVWPLFDERERSVVSHACRLGGRPLEG